MIYFKPNLLFIAFTIHFIFNLTITNLYAQTDTIQTNVPALKDVFTNDFYIGCLLSYAHIGFPDDPYVPGQSSIVAPNGGNLIKYHLNSMSPGNWMKSTYIVDINGSAAAYNNATTQEEKDSVDIHPIVRFNGNIIAQLNWAQRQGFTFRGHTLIWHNQNPGTAFFRSGYTINGTRLSKEKMTERMRNFIKEVIRIIHEGWPGLLTAMDVVNEAVNDNGTDRTANNEYYTTFGDNSYVMKAFEFARQYTIEYGETQMKLYYNDYNTHISSKADGIVRMCGPIFRAGYLDGIGMQDHDAYNSPSASQWIASYNKFDTICTEMAVTELDVRPSSNNLTEQVLTTQANQYAQLFKCFLDRSYFSGRGKIINVSKDGLNDQYAFVANASLWDAQNQCKPAFYAVVDVGINYNILDSLITYAETLEETLYTAESWLLFSEALTSAENAMEQNYSYTESAADALIETKENLVSAIEGLVEDIPLVTNGSFEESDTGSVSGLDIDGWVIEVAQSVDPLPEFEIVNDTAQDGSQSLKIVVNATGSNSWDIQVIADSIPVQPGEAYRYSIWAKAENSGAQVSFTVGNYAFNEYGFIRPSNPNVSTQWQEYTFTFTVDDQETYIRGPVHFSIAANVGNTIYIDNLRIEKYVEEYEGPPLASDQPKFVGSAFSPNHAVNFESYWNQVTPENAGKWGSVESSRDVMNWSGLDNAYNFAKDNGFPFRFHVLIWGNQQPAWIESLSAEEQLEEIEEWFEAVAAKYPDIDYLEVVNEPLNDPPSGTGNGNYIEALGGSGETGWDWIITAFTMARDIFPSTTKLYINEYAIVSSSSNTAEYLQIIRLLQERNLIDGIGAQGHSFNLGGPVTTMKRNLDSLASTGLPIQIMEFDLNYADDQMQLQNYQRVFPAFFEHPGVEGITLWGWRPGTWQTNAFLINQDGSERTALEWLRDYLDTVNVDPVSVEDIAEKPVEFHLYNNYPNPFNPSTTIKYNIAKTSKVELKVFDVLGREVQILVNEVKSPGHYTVTFNAHDLSSGVYIYQIRANEFLETKKLILQK